MIISVLKLKKKMSKFGKDCWPNKTKELNILNAPGIFVALWRIVSIWGSEKMRKRMKMRSVEEAVRLYFDEEMWDQLDVSLGGDENWDELYYEENRAKWEAKYYEIRSWYE